MRRFFTTLPENPPLGLLTLTDPVVVNHVGRVLRMKRGDSFLLVDSGQGVFCEATLENLQGKAITVQLVSLNPIPKPSNGPPLVTLGVALIKEHRWDLLLQKVTELGVHRIIPLETDHTMVRVQDADKKLVRWQGILQSAAEQCESWYIPLLERPLSVADFCSQVTSIPHKILLLERETETLPRVPCRERMSQIIPGSSLVVPIGPEGGWSEGEVDLFAQAGFKAVSFGDRILRTETAAMAFMSAIAYAYDGTHPPAQL